MTDETVDQAAPQTEVASTTVDEQSNNPPDVFEFEADDGEKLSLPKKAQAALLRQQDYTRKTQEVAEARRQLEAHQAEARASIEREREILASNRKLAALEVELEQYQAITPDQWQKAMANAQSQEEFQQVSAQKARFDALNYQVNQERMKVEQDRRTKEFQRQQMNARAMEQAAAEVRAAIPDWSESKDLELAKYAREQLGAPKDATGLPPWVIKAVHKASLYDQSLKTATNVPVQVASATKTVPQGRASGNADPDKMSIDDWMKWDAQRSKRKS